MKLNYESFKLILVCCISSFWANQTVASAIEPSAFFNFDNCFSTFSQGADDYSEFTAEITNSSGCTELSIIGDHLYRRNSMMNKHSCTPSYNSTPAMCISYDDSCNYTADSDRALRFDVEVLPGSDGKGSISSLEFYQLAPLQFNWINGANGPNNYATLYGVRVTVDGNENYRSEANEASTSWTLESFDFSNNSEFEVENTTVFQFEITPYCPIDNGAPVAVWDIDDIKITGGCAAPEGGTLSGGPFEFCVGDGESDMLMAGDITLTGNSGSNSAWVVTDLDGTILGLPPMPSAVDFDGAGNGTCLIWHLSFEDGLIGAEMGMNANELTGCFSLSNPIEVVRNDTGGACSGIQDDDILDFSIIQNPIDNMLNLELMSDDSDQAYVQIVSNTRQLVHSENINLQNKYISIHV